VFLAGRALSPIDAVTRTARKISAEDLSQRLNMRLPEDEVGRLARTFDEMIARLDEAFKRQRQFTADASHELRTPLTAIKGQTEVALQREREPEDYQEVLRAVNGQVDRMIRLVASLLTLARADAREIPVNREPVDLGTTVKDAVDQIRPAAADKSISVDVHADGGVRVNADQDLMLQLMLNLLDNAVKYTPVGGTIEVSWRGNGDHADLSVSDTGPGIAAEHLPHIFDRFYRADKARSRAGGGAGLGLSICRWIVEAHGGSISAASTPGQGSTFSVRLPAS
jgi:heavy metal sensor kinase